MVKKTCKGCSALVVNPIVCDVCGIASHPACIPRTGHPHSGNKFLDCTRPSSSGARGLAGVPLLDDIKEFIKSEFIKLRTELHEMYKSDLNAVNAAV